MKIEQKRLLILTAECIKKNDTYLAKGLLETALGINSDIPPEVQTKIDNIQTKEELIDIFDDQRFSENPSIPTLKAIVDHKKAPIWLQSFISRFITALEEGSLKLPLSK